MAFSMSFRYIAILYRYGRPICNTCTKQLLSGTLALVGNHSSVCLRVCIQGTRQAQGSNKDILTSSPTVTSKPFSCGDMSPGKIHMKQIHSVQQPEAGKIE
ncbi:unnamed protein product [Fusarium graminearum]|uniref:Chromosome 1, complete genome n=1 Tax=Gibberella zeae (strain ATCC MYA-4620 / CBS 123657 / FGSC 9075 / NRRL 31084 / PH-1) TaxID=229533 RepID=A0A098D8P6_GIBZE|nr:unnamed protein product [Fusarium graminearum]CZS78593.1 unnamed protein product [Fusarium graminearum]